MSPTSGSCASAERSTVGDARLRVSHVAIPEMGEAVRAGDVFRCKRCGEVIGVYEPLVVCAKGSVRTTSRAAEPDLDTAGATNYHRACYTAELGQE